MRKHFKVVRIISLVILMLAAFITIDFSLTFLYSLIYEANDGIVDRVC